MGTQALLSQNKHPIVGCLGAAAWSLCLLGLSISARETMFDRTAPGDHVVTLSSWSKLDSWWESITCERYGGLQVRGGH